MRGIFLPNIETSSYRRLIVTVHFLPQHNNSAGPVQELNTCIHPRYFIQCDLSGAFYVQPCGPDLFWNQEMVTCTPFNVPSQGAEGQDGDDEEVDRTGNGLGEGEETDLDADGELVSSLNRT